MIGDHAEFGDGEAVIGNAGIHGAIRLMPCEFYVMAHVRLEINAAGGDFHNLMGAVFRNCVAAISPPRQPETLAEFVALPASGV